jgi:uncharacterized protein YqjF (DUF2071 family)
VLPAIPGIIASSRAASIKLKIRHTRVMLALPYFISIMAQPRAPRHAARQEPLQFFLACT